MNTIKTSSKLDSFHIHCYPGCHGPHSPIIGASGEDLKRIYESIKKESILGQFENALYYKKNSSSFTYLIPLDQKQEADRISREIFLSYIDKYRIQNSELSEDTIVNWHWETDSPGQCYLREEISVKYRIGWHVEARVRPIGNSAFIDEQNHYLPPHLVAYHEIQHVEDILPLISREHFDVFYKNGSELKESLKTLILCDQVYKDVNQLGLYSEVNHGKFVLLNQNELPCGVVANFYRKLEERYLSLTDAILSSESIQFLQKGGI